MNLSIMPRILLEVEYVGTAYHGWQRQSRGVASVQATLEAALTQLVQHPVRLVAAGRTDAGVHARCQVVHFDTPVMRQLYTYIVGANHFLPHDIRVHAAKRVADDFNARFSALARRYQYQILNQPVASSLLHDRVLWHPLPLDVDLMHQAAQYLVGTYDFSSFRGQECQAKSPIKTVHFCNVTRQEKLIVIDIKAGGFLHHMVRNIVGVLLKIGAKKKVPEWMQDVLLAKRRDAAAMTIPPQGLYFMEVDYHYSNADQKT
ncbi:MAG: tRNA pseudouridine(38-40) synthase TruA [Gammaproteobacteria bacterium]|nr:tRNA pseudouridine(38-40) synthase TruA [Gammaproteobacteria bacterium]